MEQTMQRLEQKIDQLQAASEQKPAGCFSCLLGGRSKGNDSSKAAAGEGDEEKQEATQEGGEAPPQQKAPGFLGKMMKRGSKAESNTAPDDTKEAGDGGPDATAASEVPGNDSAAATEDKKATTYGV